MIDVAPRGVLLAGGIGTGKSTAAGFLAGLGAAVISADEAAHRAIAPGGGAFETVSGRWPSTLVGGLIDRAELARIVFDDPAQLAELEGITHPVIGIDIADQVSAADARLIVVEMPLLTASIGRGWPRVVVDVPDDVRISRLMGRGMDLDDIAARIAAQPTREEWLAAADHVIDNGGTLDALAFECGAAFERFAAPETVAGSL